MAYLPDSSGSETRSCTNSKGAESWETGKADRNGYGSRCNWDDCPFTGIYLKFYYLNLGGVNKNLVTDFVPIAAKLGKMFAIIHRQTVTTRSQL